MPPAKFSLAPAPIDRLQLSTIPVGIPSTLTATPTGYSHRRHLSPDYVDGVQEVEDNLAALNILFREAEQEKEAVDSANRSLQLSTNRYVGGADTYLQVISAQTIALENQRNDVDIRQRQLVVSVLLIKALGGGWDAASVDVSPTPAVRPVTSARSP